ncbi:hypothetical protein PSTT_16161 [Puccinia striiformis]|uniref:Uncharacterized protein n=1 Tax=Puccinia striiformis TaxID=27350 RepID=A0A2S4UEH8_9BASI|nr:hypothetical protein PSTT_16161 [Puccinia striiformis]
MLHPIKAIIIHQPLPHCRGMLHPIKAIIHQPLLFHPPHNKSLKDCKKRRDICCIEIFPPMKPTPTIHQYHTFWSLLYPILQVKMYIPKLEQVVINSKRIRIKVILEEYLAIGFP